MTKRMLTIAGVALALGGCASHATQKARTRAPAGVANPTPARAAEFVDLTHAFDKDTIYAPGTKAGFRLRRIYHGVNELGFFHSANKLSAPEHGGTHLSAPIHFAYGGTTVDAVPLSRLIAPAAVLDMCTAAAKDPHAQLRPEDVLAHEDAHGAIEANTLVLVRTCWSSRWPDRARYLGETRRGAAHHYPGISEGAAALLIDRDVAAVAIDTASVDHGPSVDFVTHRVFAAAGVPVLVNLARLDQVPVRGATVVALPMKIAGGTGGPLRVVALLGGDRTAP